MTRSTQPSLDVFMDELVARNPGEGIFHQAVQEVMESIWPLICRDKRYWDLRIPHRLVEPDRVIDWKVVWENDRQEACINRGYRVQFNKLLGPYKGGLRFHPTVNRDVLKFLGFEQVLKNALIRSEDLGGAKGGSDFDPKGRSENEIRRFCKAFMTELNYYIGPDHDIPAGDIGVGPTEIGYLFGALNRKRLGWAGASITGKGVGWGGSFLRTEATGYGLVMFAEEMLKTRDLNLMGKSIAISGSGNVAQFAAELAIKLGAKVVTMSDSSGTLYIPNGITNEQLEWIKDLKNNRRGRISEFADHFDKATYYYEGRRPWGLACLFDIAFPCATQNELSKEDAETIVENDTILVAEGANMPCEPEAVKVFLEKRILYGPGKAANAGGVAVSGLEMAEDSAYSQWEREEVQKRLKGIMVGIHKMCVENGRQNGGFVNYVDGANRGGFLRVANAMIDLGY